MAAGHSVRIVTASAGPAVPGDDPGRPTRHDPGRPAIRVGSLVRLGRGMDRGGPVQPCRDEHAAHPGQPSRSAPAVRSGAGLRRAGRLLSLRSRARGHDRTRRRACSPGRVAGGGAGDPCENPPGDRRTGDRPGRPAAGIAGSIRTGFHHFLLRLVGSLHRSPRPLRALRAAAADAGGLAAGHRRGAAHRRYRLRQPAAA